MGSLTGLVFILLFLFGAKGIKIDREYQRGIIFRLGRLKGVMGPGLYWTIDCGRHHRSLGHRD